MTTEQSSKPSIRIQDDRCHEIVQFRGLWMFCNLPISEGGRCENHAKLSAAYEEVIQMNKARELGS